MCLTHCLFIFTLPQDEELAEMEMDQQQQQQPLAAVPTAVPVAAAAAAAAVGRALSGEHFTGTAAAAAR